MTNQVRRHAEKFGRPAKGNDKGKVENLVAYARRNFMVPIAAHAVLTGWQLPECFADLRRLLEARLKKHASREYIQVLRLLEPWRSKKQLMPSKMHCA